VVIHQQKVLLAQMQLVDLVQVAQVEAVQVELEVRTQGLVAVLEELAQTLMD
jgi:hypothetical protein